MTTRVLDCTGREPQMGDRVTFRDTSYYSTAERVVREIDRYGGVSLDTDPPMKHQNRQRAVARGQRLKHSPAATIVTAGLRGGAHGGRPVQTSPCRLLDPEGEGDAMTRRDYRAALGAAPAGGEGPTLDSGDRHLAL